LRGLSVAAGYAKLRIAAAQEETGTASGAVASIVIIIVITHRRPMPSIPVAISVTIPFVAAFTPTSAVKVITISRGTLAPCRGSDQSKPNCQYQSFLHFNLLSDFSALSASVLSCRHANIPAWKALW
jgi:hypothetical protein